MQARRFLLVAASIGSGHIKAAEAIAEELKIKYPEAEVDIVDFTKWRVSPATAFMKSSYLTMLRFVPNLYDLMYKFTGGRAGGISVQNLISALTARDIAALVRQYRPDVLICTHPFPAGAASWRKERHPDEFYLATVITDYSVHQMWIYQNVQQYFVAREAMKSDLLAAGLRAERVTVTGIPISRAFRQREDRNEACTALGLRPELPVVLIMGGGLGLGGVESSLQELEKITQPLQILVVAGYNAKLKEKVEAMAEHSRHYIEAWGFSPCVHELMSAATLLITKPGALTLTEAMAMELPLLLHEPIPGPETDNAVYAARRGAAVWANDASRLGESIRSIIESKEKIEEMQASARRMRKPRAAEDIVAVLENELKDK